MREIQYEGPLAETYRVLKDSINDRRVVSYIYSGDGRTFIGSPHALGNRNNATYCLVYIHYPIITQDANLEEVKKFWSILNLDLLHELNEVPNEDWRTDEGYIPRLNSENLDILVRVNL